MYKICIRNLGNDGCLNNNNNNNNNNNSFRYSRFALEKKKETNI